MVIQELKRQSSYLALVGVKLGVGSSRFGDGALHEDSDTLFSLLFRFIC